MSKRLTPLIFVFLVVFFLKLIIFNHQTPQNSFKKVEPTQVVSKKNYFPKPGNVANVFGWGYHRTSCPVPGTDQNILFFYAEDQNLYYVFTNNLKNSRKVKLGRPINPDYNIYCDNEKLYVNYTDPNQGHLYLSTGKISSTDIQLTKHEYIISGRESYTIVAPHMRLLDGSPFISYMEYGRPKTDYPNSKGKIVYKKNGKWIEQVIIEASAEKTQVLGISLETFKDTLVSIMAPYPGDLYYSIFDKKKKLWQKPTRLLQEKTRGQLEWETISDADNNLYLIYRDVKSGLSVASLKNTEKGWKVERVADSLAAQAFSIFKMEDGRIFILYNDAQLVHINDLNNPVRVTEITSDELYFLQVSRRNNHVIYPFWLSGTDGSHIIEHTSFDIRKYYP